MSTSSPVYANSIVGARTPASASASHVDHLLGLDLLRGIAALAVVLYHLSSRVELPACVSHGYLAVDFFFVLSGFVMARAYEARIADGRLSIVRFGVSRAIRLLPVIVLGTLIAAVIEIGRPGIMDQKQHAIDTALALVSGSVLVPTLHVTTLEHILFPLNGPAWSLLMETIASAIFALYARFLESYLVLQAVLIICAAAISWGAHQNGSADLGALPETFWLGLARIGWSFTAGMLLFRFRDRTPRIFFGFPLTSLILILLTPKLSWRNDLFDDLCIFLAFPAIVLAASTVRLTGFGRRASILGGDLSYPIYGIHYPLVRLFTNIGQKIQFVSDWRVLTVVVGTAVIIAISSLACLFYDVPVRRFLTSKITFSGRKRLDVPNRRTLCRERNGPEMDPPPSDRRPGEGDDAAGPPPFDAIDARRI